MLLQKNRLIKQTLVFFALKRDRMKSLITLQICELSGMMLICTVRVQIAA